MSKNDLTLLLALAMAAHKAGLIKRDALKNVNNVCSRAAQMHKIMGERDVLVIQPAVETKA